MNVNTLLLCEQMTDYGLTISRIVSGSLLTNTYTQVYESILGHLFFFNASHNLLTGPVSTQWSAYAQPLTLDMSWNQLR